MTAQYELVFIFFSVIVGVLSAAYFYLSTDAFEHLNLLHRSIRWIAAGTLSIAVGVLIAAFISYEEQQGLALFFYGIPLQVVFYVIYIIGSVMILVGARRFTSRPSEQIVNVAL